MKSIQDSLQKIKLFVLSGVGEWGIPVLVLLVAFSAFGLGRLSVLTERTPISLAKAGVAPKAMAPGGLLEASKNGSEYFYPWCPGAADIQPLDQVWFKDRSAAERAGYVPAKSCKGLTANEQ